MINFDSTTILSTEKPIFVFASGHRCGSTLLQRLLNSCPDVLVWGEQNGYLSPFVRNFKTLLEWEAKFSSQRKTFLTKGFNNFVPNMLPEDHELITAARIYLVSLFGAPAAKLGKRIWGFKEVRYGINVAFFLQELFPKARFIHLTRNVIDCFISMKHWEDSNDPWNRQWTEKSIENWQIINEDFFEAADHLNKFFHVKYEQMVDNPDGFAEALSDFLELPLSSFDRSVFQIRLHGQEYRGKNDREKMLPSDLNDEEKALLSRDNIVRTAEKYNYRIEF